MMLLIQLAQKIEVARDRFLWSYMDLILLWVLCHQKHAVNMYLHY